MQAKENAILVKLLEQRLFIISVESAIINNDNHYHYYYHYRLMLLLPRPMIIVLINAGHQGYACWHAGSCKNRGEKR
ncbi:hypothetical protein D3C77_232520 [compost metagenome]